MKISLSPTLIRQYAIVTIVNFGALTTGMSLGWPSPVIVKLTNGTDTPLSRPITENEGSWIVSGGYLAVVGIIFLGGMLIDGLGRKYCFILVSVPKLLVAVWTIFVTEVWMLIFCRVVMVLCDCFVMVVVPVYASEIACKEHRGSLGTFLNIFLSIGTVLIISVGPFLSYLAINSFIAAFIAVTTLPVIFLPDSPLHLYKKGRIDDAIKVLSLIRDSDVIIKQELEDYRLSSEEYNIDKMALLKNKLFKSKLFMKALLLGLLLCVGANLIGYLALSFYLQTILESTNTSVQPEIASAIIGGVQLFGSFCSPFLTKKFGRRPILIVSLFGMCCGMVGLGTFFLIAGTYGYTVSGFMNYLPLISLILFIYGYITGIGNLMFVVTPELFDGSSRAIGYAICLTPGGLITFLISKYFAQIISAIGPVPTYYFFGSMCVLVITLIAIFLPETKGKTFNEIQTELDKKLVHIQCTRRKTVSQCTEKTS